MRNALKQQQKQLPIRAIVTLAIGISAVVTILTLSGIFKSTDVSAAPANAASFSEICYSIADGDANLYEFNKLTGSPSSNGNTGIGSPEGV